MKYRISYSKRRDKYLIQHKSWLFWSPEGQIACDYQGGTYIDVDYFDTKEQAIKQLANIVKIRTLTENETNRRKQKQKDFTPIEITTQDIKEKFPELFL